MPPLPGKLPRRLRESTTLCRGYEFCLEFEKDVPNQPPPKTGPNRLILARILGYLIIHGPGDLARRVVATDVIACEDYNDMATLGRFYHDYYLRIFKASKSRTPTSSNHISQPSFDTRKDMMKAMLVEEPQDHRGAKKNALVRDGFRCVVTGKYDLFCVEKNEELQEIVNSRDNGLTITKCAHIFPEPISVQIPDTDEGGDKHGYASTVWTIISRFGYDLVSTQSDAGLNGAQIHRLENVLTLDAVLHTYFDRLSIWFEATDVPNRYKLGVSTGRILFGYPDYVTFTSADPQLPLPSPTYLAIHAACAKVAHLSGAAEYMNEILEDLEDTRVLSSDGSSEEVLDYLFLRHQLSVY